MSLKIAHKYRSTEDGILVGVNTILDDDPSLTLRKWNGKHPNRYVLDPNLRLHDNLKILKDKYFQNVTKLKASLHKVTIHCI